MLIICDYRLPEEIKNNLRKRGEVVDFRTEGIVYEAISGHPDIFFHKAGNVIVHAPNVPSKYLKIIDSNNVNLISGEKPLGKEYPNTIYYNAVADKNKLYCNSKFIDSVVVNAHKGKEVVHLNQGYAACNLVIGNKSVLTSDKGIYKQTSGFYLSPAEIVLQGVENGFIGGCCTIFQDEIFLNGSLDCFSESIVIEEFAYENNLRITELYHGPLMDGGGLLILDE